MTVIKYLFALCFSFFIFHSSFSQVGGQGTYQFLNLAASPRSAALGGNILAIKDHDISLALVNPSLITKEMDKTLAFNFVDYYSDISYGSITASKTFKKYGSFAGSMQFVNYGKFIQADANANVMGEFLAAEYAFTLGWGRQLDSNFSIGANIKGLYSHMFSDITNGIGADVAVSYSVPSRNFTVSLVARNAGKQLRGYQTGHTEPLPFQLSLAMSKKLKHLPFRYSIIFNRLDKYDLSYDDPAEDKVDPITNEPVKKDKVGKFFDNLGRHFIIGGEFTPSNALALRVGYNYERRKELGVDTRMSTVGFSWGIGLRIKQFQFNYSRSTYHLAGSPNYVSVVVDLGKLI
ncbi:MAG: type IX secretion system protein PorQ [Bacteroidales bacterium]